MPLTLSMVVLSPAWSSYVGTLGSAWMKETTLGTSPGVVGSHSEQLT